MSNQDKKTIYDLKLHETVIIDSYSGEQSSKSFTVVRVPGFVWKRR